MYDYDLFTIGGGSGGVRASRMAAQFGARVALAEERYLGGTCVNVGCIPKKILVYAAEFSEDFNDSAGFGWTVGDRNFNWRTLVANKDREIARLNARHLGRQGPTDVIAFGLTRVAGEPVIGDVYIAPMVARANAKRLGVGMREELVRLVVHGVLHVLGYDHPETTGRTASPMWRRQERYLRGLR